MQNSLGPMGRESVALDLPLISSNFPRGLSVYPSWYSYCRCRSNLVKHYGMKGCHSSLEKSPLVGYILFPCKNNTLGRLSLR